jgi:hypothetical protein
VATHLYWRLSMMQPSGGSAFACTEISMAATSGGTNLCTGGTPFADQSFSGTTPGDAFDANVSTIWSSTTGPWPMNIGYQFASAVEINEVKVTARNDSFFTQAPARFVLEYSDDGSTYHPWMFVDWGNFGSAGTTKTALKPSGDAAGSHAYWGILIYDVDHPNGSFGPCCSEFEWRATAGGTDQATGGTAHATLSFSSSFNQDKAYDNDTTTYWSTSSASFPQDISYHFTGAVSVAELAMISQNNSDYLQTPSIFDVMWSDDGIVWPMGWHQTATWTAQTQTKTFANPIGQAGFTIPSVTLTAPEISAGSSGAAGFTIPSVTLTAPTVAGGAAGAAGYTLPQVVLTAPEVTVIHAGAASYTIPQVTLTPPGFTIAFVTQEMMTVLALPPREARVTFGAILPLAKIATDARVTDMALLVLARGGPAPLVPDPLSLHDMGRDPVLRQRVVNMYVEPTPQGPAKTAHYQRPGLYSVAQRGGGPGRATFLFQGFRITVSGGTVWRDAINIGVIPDDPKTRFAVSEEECVVCAGGRAWYITLDAVTQITDPDLPRVRDVLFIAGRFIYIHDDTSGQYSWSEVNDAANIDGLAFASAESSPDPLVGGIVLGDNILFLGTVSGEWHYPADDINAPFQRSKGRRYDKGCPAIRSIVLADNSGFFISNDRFLYRTGAVPQRVSNYDVEDSLRKVTDADLPDITAYTVTFGGHVFYVMNLPLQGTWAYDIGQGLWARWLTHKKDRFRVDFCDNNYMMDIYTGHIFGFEGQQFFDFSTDADGTDPIERVCATYYPLPTGVMNNFNISLFCTRGVGLPGVDGEYGTQPVVEMRFSDGEGGDFTEWMEAYLGAIGDKSKAALALWTQLGMMSSPGRLFEFRCSDPVFFAPYAVRANEAIP